MANLILKKVSNIRIIRISNLVSIFKKITAYFEICCLGLKNPLDGKPIENVYGEGETYKNKFSKLSSAYEECRAESVGLYLCGNDDVLNSFGIDEEEKQDVVYTNWLSLCHRALTSIFNYSPTSKKWTQAHR